MCDVFIYNAFAKITDWNNNHIVRPQRPTKTKNMGNLFPIKETSWVITISFTANVRSPYLGGYNGRSIQEQFVARKKAEEEITFAKMKNSSIANFK